MLEDSQRVKSPKSSCQDEAGGSPCICKQLEVEREPTGRLSFTAESRTKKGQLSLIRKGFLLHRLSAQPREAMESELKGVRKRKANNLQGIAEIMENEHAKRGDRR